LNNYNCVYDSYQSIPGYDKSNLYFHWVITKSDNYVCEIEEIITNHKPSTILIKEYRLNGIKLFRLDDGNQHCKIWFIKDGMNIIIMWFVEYR
jgi:hypothetical protein